MTARKVMIATTSFSAGGLDALAGKHPAVVFPGVVQQGTRLWSDDPIVLASPTFFVDADILPGATHPDSVQDARDDPPAVARGLTDSAIRRAAAAEREATDGAPTREAVAGRLHTSVPTLKRAMKDLGMGHWPPPAPED
jgi:hypothetical protein